MDSDVLTREQAAERGIRRAARTPTTTRCGGGPPSSTRSTSAASRTAAATARATSPASARTSATSRTSASTRSGSTPGTRARWPTAATTSRDYRDIHPQFGTLAEAEALIAEALALGIRTIIDVVPNHISDQHQWFQAALAAGPGSPERERFWFHPGKGEDGDEIPTHWVSSFQGDDLDPHHEPRRHAGGVVPAHVHARAARPQLEPPRRAPRARGHPAVLVRPRCRGRAHRLRGPADQGCRPARGRREAGPRRAPDRGPRRAARRVPVVARDRRLVPGHARARRRDLGARHRPVHRLPAARRDAHGVQLRLPRAAVGRGILPRLDRSRRSPRTRPSARRARGCSATTTSRGRSPATAAKTPRSRSSRSASACRPTRASAATARAPRRCSSRRCREASTSIRATSSACPRSRTCRSSSSRTRCTTAPAGSTRDGTDAACRCRGRETARRSASAPKASSTWLPQPAEWSALTVEAQQADPASTLNLYREALRLRRELPELGDGPLEWWDDAVPGRRRRPRLPPRRRASRASSTPATTAGAAPARRDRPRSRAHRSTTRRRRRRLALRATPQRGCASTTRRSTDAAASAQRRKPPPPGGLRVERLTRRPPPRKERR